MPKIHSNNYFVLQLSTAVMNQHDQWGTFVEGTATSHSSNRNCLVSSLAARMVIAVFYLRVSHTSYGQASKAKESTHDATGMALFFYNLFDAFRGIFVILAPPTKKNENIVFFMRCRGCIAGMTGRKARRLKCTDMLQLTIIANNSRN